MRTLIMLPGMMCDERLFSSQTAHLRGQYDVRVLPIHEYQSIEAIAKNVLEKAPAKFALLGLSMGGIVAMEVVKQARKRVTHLALLDTNPIAESEHVKLRRGPQIQKVKNGCLTEVMRDEMKPNYLVDSPQKPAILELCMAMAKKLGDEAFVNQSIALRDRPDYQNVLADISIPSLILGGREDLLCPVERHELMHSLIKGSQLTFIDDAGHLPTLEQPSKVNDALDAWLEHK
ncbi:alpha/beta fold hydrolase [Lentilitoribacter sp. EG35]|uniref:alpha/beta fold hydrolase n=1 Tax=Lentilitoribacter sp. EG35 TaxID=3234192 RepID=UPI003460943E